MIAFTPVGPPPGFAFKVHAAGRTWAIRTGWDWSAPPPPGCASQVPAYWTRCLDDLHALYGGICAYLCVYSHRSMDASSVDHFLPKSKAPLAQAFDWTNYRLASRPMNTNKREHEDVLDPFAIPQRLFVLNLLSGRLRINDHVAPLHSPLRARAQETLERLGLNAGEYRNLRLTYIDNYLRACFNATQAVADSARETLRLQSPFIHAEVLRQGW